MIRPRRQRDGSYGPIPPPTLVSPQFNRARGQRFQMTHQQRKRAIEMERIAFAHLEVNKTLDDAAPCDCVTLMDALSHLEYFA